MTDPIDVLAKIAARRHPHQVFLAALLVAAGMPVLLGGPRPGSLAALLPVVLVYLWAVVIVVGGAMVVAAALIRSAVNALYLEFAADLPVGVMCVVYATAIGVAAGWTGFTTLSILVGAGIAFIVRAWQVGKTIRHLRRELERRTDDDG